MKIWPKLLILHEKIPISYLFSRIDIKRHSKPQDFFLVASTGDMLETKPILDPSTCNKTELTTKNKNKHVIELSCDVYNGVVLSSTESQTLSR